MRTSQDGLLQIQMVCRGVANLSAKARNIVRVREMRVIINHKPRYRDFSAEWIARVGTEHQVRCVVPSPRPRVIEVVLGVERIVADQAAEEPDLYRQAIAYR